MATATLTPTGLVVNEDWNVTGAATAVDALSDGSDASYVRPTFLSRDLTLRMSSTPLAANERVRSLSPVPRTEGGPNPPSIQVKSGLDLLAEYQFPTPSPFPFPFADRSTSPVSATPSREVTADDLSDGLTVAMRNQRTDTVSLLVSELSLVVDYRERPVVSSPSVQVDASGSPTYQFDVTYDTAADDETLGFVVEVRQGGALIDRIQATRIMVDPTAETVTMQGNVGALAPGQYSATVTAVVYGFSNPNPAWESEPISIAFAVQVAGVPEPEVECFANPDGTVTIEVEQITGVPPSGDTLYVTTFDDTYAGGVISVAGSTPDPINHATVWVSPSGDFTNVDGIVVTGELTINGTAFAFEAENVEPVAGEMRIVFACSSPTGDAQFASTEVSGPDDIVEHGFSTTDIVVQAISPDDDHAEIGIEILDTDRIQVGDAIPAGTNILIVGPGTGADIIGESLVVPGGPGEFTIPHQYALGSLFATAVSNVSNLEVWPGIHVEPFAVVVENQSTDDLTLFLAGEQAEFDDPNDVRIEVTRDGVLWPFDGQGRNACPDVPVEIIDRFPPRCPTPGSPCGSVAGDCNHEGIIVDCDDIPVYRVRLYGYVNGVRLTSGSVECSPGCVAHNGKGFLRSLADPALDIAVDVTAQEWDRTRPFNSVQPVGGGYPIVYSGDLGGRDYQLEIFASSTPETYAVEAVLGAPIIFYQPADPCSPGVWLAPGSGSVSDYQAPGRPHDLSWPFVEIEAPPVLLPDPGNDGECA